MSPARLHVVEDSPADIELFKKAVETLDHAVDVTVSRDGKQFLEALEESPAPDLVLLDLDLPKLDGFDVLEILEDGGPSPPIVVLTMSNAQEDIAASYKSGANACITKPLGFEDFRGVLDATLTFWLTTAQVPADD